MIIIRPEAENDIQQAYEWYSSIQAKLGIRFIKEIEKIFNSIEINPQMYHKVLADLRRAFCKKFPYAIYFKTEKSDITIIAVLHQRRNPIEWEKRIF